MALMAKRGANRTPIWQDIRSIRFGEAWAIRPPCRSQAISRKKTGQEKLFSNLKANVGFDFTTKLPERGFKGFEPDNGHWEGDPQRYGEPMILVRG